jgi:uncharacterized protein (DUF934 family)
VVAGFGWYAAIGLLIGGLADKSDFLARAGFDVFAMNT